MVLLYTGTVYWGGHRVDRLFEALRLLEPGERARIRVRFHHGALEALREQGKDLDDCLELRPPLPYLDSLRAQREADALLYLPWDGPGGDDIAHGKLYEYLGARRPILAVGSPRNVWVRMLRDRGAAEAGERAEEVAGVLRRWLRERPLPPTPAEAAAGVERERQFRVLEEVLREAAWGQDRGLRAGP